MIKTATLAYGVMVAALTVGTSNIHAQFPPPPRLPSNLPQVPQRDISSEITRMTKRYALSDDQVNKVRTILENHAKKANEIAKDDTLSPEARVNHLLTVREDEIAQVSDVLTPEQREKYQADVHPSGPPEEPANGESRPPSQTLK